MVLTDGVSNTGEDPVPVAQELKDDGVLVFSVGVGSFNSTQLEAIASGPDFVFLVDNFPDLNTKVQEIVEMACENSNCSEYTLKPR